MRPVAQRVAARVVKSWVSNPASEWVTQQVTLWRVVGGRWHMTGQARVASHQRPLPIHLCLPPFLPTLHTLILHTSTCYALARKLPANNPRNCHPATRLQGNITRKTLQRVPARVPGNQSKIHLFPNSDSLTKGSYVTVKKLYLASLQTSLLIAREEAGGGERLWWLE